MANLLQKVKKHISIPLGILIVGILTFLFGPGQCTKNNLSDSEIVKSEVSDENAIGFDDVGTESKEASLNISDSKPLTYETKELTTTLNLVDSIINYRYEEIDEYINEYGIDSALANIYENRYSSYTNEQNEFITKYIKGLLIRKEYNVDAVYKNTSPGLTIIEKDEMYGFIDTNGVIVHQIIFEHIDPIRFHPYTAVSNGEKWGLMDSIGIIAIPMEYDSVNIILDSDNYCKLFRSNVIDVLNLKTGKFEYEDLHTFQRIWAEHIVLNIGNKYALFDLQFDRLLEGNYDLIESFDGGDDYYIKVVDRSKVKYYDLGMKQIDNPLFN